LGLGNLSGTVLGVLKKLLFFKFKFFDLGFNRIFLLSDRGLVQIKGGVVRFLFVPPRRVGFVVGARHFFDDGLA